MSAAIADAAHASVDHRRSGYLLSIVRDLLAADWNRLNMDADRCEITLRLGTDFGEGYIGVVRVEVRRAES